MPVKLTPLGEKAVKVLSETATAPVSAILSPGLEFTVVRRQDGWTLANDALLMMAGVGFKPSSDNPIEVGQCLADALGVAPALADELVYALFKQGLIAISPLSIADQMQWLETVMSEVLSHETRLRLLVALSLRPIGNQELCELMGGLPKMSMRHHLDILLGHHFVDEGREGRVKYYSVCVPMMYVLSRRINRLLVGGSNERTVPESPVPAPAADW